MRSHEENCNKFIEIPIYRRASEWKRSNWGTKNENSKGKVNLMKVVSWKESGITLESIWSWYCLWNEDSFKLGFNELPLKYNRREKRDARSRSRSFSSICSNSERISILTGSSRFSRFSLGGGHPDFDHSITAYRP